MNVLTQPFEALRAEDFQKAWPTALQNALVTVSYLQSQLECQQYEFAVMVKKTAQMMGKERDALSQVLADGHRLHTQQFSEVQQSLVQHAEDLASREQAFARQCQQKLAHIRQQHDLWQRYVAEIQSAPWWRRMYWILLPDKMPAMPQGIAAKGTGTAKVRTASSTVL